MIDTALSNICEIIKDSLTIVKKYELIDRIESTI